MPNNDLIEAMSVVREFFVDIGMNPGDVMVKEHEYPHKGPFFFIRVPNGDLVEIVAKTGTLIRIQPVISRIPVRNIRTNKIWWMESSKFMDFNLINPDSLDKIKKLLDVKIQRI